MFAGFLKNNYALSEQWDSALFILRLEVKNAKYQESEGTL
jgi:hypothetical protein